MSVLSSIQKICPRIGLSVPSAVFSSAVREHVELQELATDTAKMIGEVNEWQKLATLHTITGDGSTEDWDLPDDWGWMPNDSQLWSSELAAPLTQIKSKDEWLRDLVLATPTLVNSWILYGDQFHIRAALSSGATAKTFYQTNEYVLKADASLAAEFSADDDTFRLGERLFELGMIYRWKLDKGLPYAQHEDEYGQELERRIGRDKGPRQIRVGRGGLPRGVTSAYPSRLGGS